MFCKSERLFLSSIFKYCLGKLFRDKGQSLEPLPPERIIGIKSKLGIDVLLKLSKILKIKFVTIFY